MRISPPITKPYSDKELNDVMLTLLGYTGTSILPATFTHTYLDSIVITQPPLVHCTIPVDSIWIDPLDLPP